MLQNPTNDDFGQFYIAHYDRRIDSIQWSQKGEPGFVDFQTFKKALRRGQSFIHRDGKELYLVQYFPIPNDPNQSIFMVNTLVMTRNPDLGNLVFHGHIVNEISQSIVVSSRERKVMVWNRAAERIYGWKGEETIGRDLLDFKLAPRYTPEREQEALQILKEQQSFQYESVHRRKNGVEFPVRVFNSIIADSHGEVYAIITVTADITEEKNVESKLIAGQQELDLFFNNDLYGAFFMMLDEPIEWGPDVDREAVLDYVFEHQRVTRINQAMLDQYRATEEEFIGVRPKDFFAHDIEQGRYIWRTFFDMGRWKLETDERRMDGSRVFFEGDYFLLYNEEGKIIGHFGVQQDITERRENEEQLSRSEKKLKKLTENLPNVVFEFVRTADGVYYFDFLSEGIENLDTGIPIEEFYASVQIAFDIIHPDDLSYVFRMLDASVSGEKLVFEFRLKNQHGEYRWIRSTSHPELNHGEMRWYGIYEDITEEKKRNDELRRLALAAQNTSDFILTCLADGTAIWCNTSGVSPLGYSSEQIIGASILDRIYKHCDDANMCNTFKKAFLAKEVFSIILKVKRKDESTCYLELRGTPIYNDDEEFNYFLIIERDLTEVYQKQSELVKAVGVTREQNARLKEFTYIVSHNIRSHSSNFTSLTGLLKNERDPDEKRRIIDMLGDVSENLERTIQHLNQIVSVNEDADQHGKYVPVEYLVQSGLKNISEVIKTTRSKINVDCDKDLSVFGYPAYLESIFHNLITNAIKYAHPNRVPELNIVGRHIGSGVQVSFSDNGLGIDLKKYGDKLFGMYRTFHPNTDSRGIGLYITKNQLDAMGATVKVRSIVGRGTTFELFFPDDSFD